MWKSRVLVSLVLVASISLIVGYVGSNIGFVLLYSLLFLILVSIVSLLFAKKAINIRIDLLNPIIFKGQDIDFKLTLVNKSLFYYPNIKYTFNDIVGIRYKDVPTQFANIGAGKKITETYQMLIPYRGVYEIGIKEIEVVDFLGLFRRKLYPKNPISVVVYPSYTDDLSAPLLNTPQLIKQHKDFYASEDYTQIADVRYYDPSSDHLKKIHWKLSAARGQLLVKNFDTLEPNRVTVYLDAVPPPYDGEYALATEDTLTYYAASVISYIIKSNLKANFIYGQPDIERRSISNISDIMLVLDILAKVPFNGDNSYFDRFVAQMPEDNTVLLLSSLNKTKLENILQLIGFERETIIYFFYPDSASITAEDQSAINSLREYGALVHPIAVSLK